MIDLLVRSLVLAALGLLALLAVRRRSASVRHLVALSSLAAMLALPLFGRLVPPARLPVLPAPPVETTVAPTVVTYETATVTTLPVSAPEPEPSAKAFPWALLWPLGSLLLLLRWAFGWGWLALRLRRAERVERLDAPLPVLESDAFGIPLVAWTPRARIVLPRGWREWPAERLDVVLRHETAHVQRGDGLAMLVARLAVALFWPNPLVWLLARAEARLAERATDDLVVSEGVPAVRYAHELLALARSTPAPAALPALGMARPVALSHRVEMILKPSLSRSPVARRARLGAALAALAVALPVAVAALGSQASPAPKAPDFSVRVVPHSETVAFLLRCKVVRTTDHRTLYQNDSAAEPQIGQSDPTRVAVAPRVYAPNHGTVDLKVSVGGKDLTVQLTPDSVDDARWSMSDPRGSRMIRLRAVTTMPIPKGVRDYNVWSYTLHTNGWGLYTLTNPGGGDTGYQMLVQVTPYKQDGPVPAAAAPPAPSGTLPSPSPAAPAPAALAPLAARLPIASAPPAPPAAPLPAPRAAPIPLTDPSVKPQAIPPATASQGKGTFVARGDAQLVLLKCKLVRTDDPGPGANVISMQEPTVGDRGRNTVVSAPVLKAVIGRAATIDIRGDGTDMNLRLLPEAGAGDVYKITTEVFASMKGASHAKLHALALLRPNEWVRYRLLDEEGRFYGYHLLIQFVPVA